MSTDYQDPELNLMTEWSAPSPRADFRSRVMNAFDRECQPQWRRMSPNGIPFLPFFAKSILIGLPSFALLLLVLPFAFPQTLQVILPGGPGSYKLYYEWFRVADNGLETIDQNITLYLDPATRAQFMLSRTYAGRPMATVTSTLLVRTGVLLYPFFRQARSREQAGQTAAFLAKLIQAGCVYGPSVQNEVVLGRAMMLNHPVTEVRRDMLTPGTRTTEWRAPDFNCIVIKSMMEQRHSDGTYHATYGTRVVRIDVKP